MARPKNSHDTAPMIRGAFKRACLMLDGEGEKGEGLSTLILESLRDDVRGTLQAIKGFVPKELDVQVDAKELTHEEWLLKLNGGDDEQGVDAEA
jgi:hypothetical protein